MGEKQYALARRPSAPQRDPSWPTVVRTTFRLWLERRGVRRRPPKRRQRGLLALIILVICLVAALVTVVVVRLGATSGTPGRGTVADKSKAGQGLAGQGGGPAVVGAALTRAEAATWIAQEVNPDAIVGCDPAMCSALQGAGLTAGRLLALQLSAADPLGAGIVVATPAIRSQFGTRLAGVYAPQVIASFGSGATQIDIRSVAPDGTNAFEASLTAGRTARITAGHQLLRNQRVHVSAAARTVLVAGSADPRLLVTLAGLAAQQQRMNIVSFGDPSPGAPDVPLREVEIGAATTAKLRSMLSFLHAQRAPYLPAQAVLVRAGRGRYLISIQYDAPSPLGLASGP